MEQLSALDAIFAYTDTSTTPMHIGQLAIYDPSTAPKGKVGFKDILRYMEGRLDGARIFRQKLARVPFDLDHPYWIEDENFDLEYHVRHIALPKPGDWRQLCILASRIYARPLDMNRPLWEYTVIEGLDNVEGFAPGCFAILGKMHHAAMDGKSGVQMSLALHDMTPDMPRRTFDMDWKPEPVPTNLDLLGKAYINTVTNPVKLIKTAQRLLPVAGRMREFNQQFGKREGEKVPETCFSGKATSHRVFDARTFLLSDVKKIRTAFPGTTVNDVMLAIVGGAMRAYLKEKKDLPKQSLWVEAPVSVRDDDSKASGGNKVTTMYLEIGTHIEDAGERLEFVHAETQRSKAYTRALGADTLMEVSGALPSGLVAAGTKLAVRMGMGSNNPRANTTVTNVPGPPFKQYFAGAEMVGGYGMGLIVDGVGIFHVISSMVGKITISALADRRSMPDPERYAECLEDSFAAMMAAAKKGPKKKASKKPKPKKKPAGKSTAKKTVAKKAAAKKPVRKRRTPAPTKAGRRRKTVRASTRTKKAQGKK